MRWKIRLRGQNQNLRAALENYLAARDQVRMARADFYPTLSGNASGDRAKVSAHRPLVPAGAGTQYTDLQLGGQASWEPDLWGRVRRNVEAAHESAQANAADLANLDLVVCMRNWRRTTSNFAGLIPMPGCWRRQLPIINISSI